MKTKAMTQSEKRNLVRKYLMTRAKEDFIVQIIYPYYRKNFTQLLKEALDYAKSGAVLL
jgi:hypothetical protein